MVQKSFGQTQVPPIFTENMVEISPGASQEMLCGDINETTDSIDHNSSH